MMNYGSKISKRYIDIFEEIRVLGHHPNIWKWKCSWGNLWKELTEFTSGNENGIVIHFVLFFTVCSFNRWDIIFIMAYCLAMKAERFPSNRENNSYDVSDWRSSPDAHRHFRGYAWSINTPATPTRGPQKTLLWTESRLMAVVCWFFGSYVDYPRQQNKQQVIMKDYHLCAQLI